VACSATSTSLNFSVVRRLAGERAGDRLLMGGQYADPEAPLGAHDVERARAAVEAGEHQRRVQRQRAHGVRGRPGRALFTERGDDRDAGGAARPSSCGMLGRRRGHHVADRKYDAAGLAQDRDPNTRRRRPGAARRHRPRGGRGRARRRRVRNPGASSSPTTIRTTRGPCSFRSAAPAVTRSRPPGAQGSANRALRQPGPEPERARREPGGRPLRDSQRRLLGAIMPQNILVGDEADAVAHYRRRVLRRPGRPADKARRHRRRRDPVRSSSRTPASGG